MKKNTKISLRIFWCTVIFALFLFLFLVFAMRIKSSNNNWSFFSCKLTGKETLFTQCDDRITAWELSWNNLSFYVPQGIASVYIPFTSPNINLSIDESANLSYDYWIVYDNFWWKELQKVDGEIVIDISEDALEESLNNKKNNNFWFSKDKTGKKNIKIDTGRPFNTHEFIGYPNIVKNTFLTKWKHAKGVIMMIMWKAQKVSIQKIEIL